MMMQRVELLSHSVESRIVIALRACQGPVACAAAVRLVVDDDGNVGARGRCWEGGKETCCALRHGLAGVKLMDGRLVTRWPVRRRGRLI